MCVRQGGTEHSVSIAENNLDRGSRRQQELELRIELTVVLDFKLLEDLQVEKCDYWSTA